MEKSEAQALLAQSINQVQETPAELIDKLFALSRLKEFAPGEIVLRAGEVPQYLGVNIQGLFRLFYIDSEGQDSTKGFSSTGNLVVSYSALAEGRESHLYIEALEPSTVLLFSYAKFKALIQEDLRWYPYVYSLLESVYLMKERREKSFLLLNATERYQAFRQEYAAIEKRLKLYHIASFLGITPEALSRIRKKLALN
jgi:CRP-like cAMP-binding protein